MNGSMPFMSKIQAGLGSWTQSRALLYLAKKIFFS